MRPLLLALLLSGCAGPITNALFLEDADFVSALPDADRHTVHYTPPIASRVPVALPEGSPDLRTWTAQITDTVNDGIFEILDLVDLVRGHPPTTRTEDGRTWGPWDVQDGAWLLVEIDRSGVGEYAWSFSLSDVDDGPWVVGLSGTHWAGTSVAAGDGEFDAHVGAIAGILGEDAEGEIAVDYDNREGIDLSVTFEGFRTAGASGTLDATYDYVEDPAGNGDFQFGIEWDVAEGKALEHVAARSRWTASGALRAEASLSGGDLVDLVVTITQCWDEEGTLVFQGDDAGLFETVGSVEDCAFPG